MRFIKVDVMITNYNNDELSRIPRNKQEYIFTKCIKTILEKEGKIHEHLSVGQKGLSGGSRLQYMKGALVHGKDQP